MNKGFRGYHPLVNFLYFFIIVVYTMFMMHPCFLLLSLVASFAYSIYLNGKGAVKFNFLFVLPIILFCIVFNPLFNHEGVTILTYFPSGNPLTLESIAYGVAAALMLAGVILWFSCYNAVVTSDKFIYLFGRIIPSISLVFSMVLRFVPKFKNQAIKISNAQKCIGKDITNGTMIDRAKNGIKIIFILVTWALENGIETADSMRSRGYGLPGRTSFSIYRFTFRDRVALGVLLILTIWVFVAICSKSVFAVYYPQIMVNGLNAAAVFTYCNYSILCFFPFIIDIMEDLQWHALKSRI